MAKDPTDSPVPINKMIFLDQLKRYNENIKEWADNKFFTSNNAHNMIDRLFGVGYVWISYTNTSPASLVGGTWTPITGRFPYFNAGNSIGGANTHTLTEAEMPSHSHSAKSWHNVVQQYEGIASKPCVAWEDWLDDGSGAWSNRTGGGGSHNNMPAYQTLYAWRRVE